MTLFRILIKFVTFPYFLLKTGNIKAAMLFAHYNLPFIPSLILNNLI